MGILNAKYLSVYSDTGGRECRKCNCRKVGNASIKFGCVDGTVSYLDRGLRVEALL